MGPSCFGGYEIQGLWRLDPQRMNGREGQGDRESEGGKGGGWCNPLCSSVGPHFIDCGKVEGRAAHRHLPNGLIQRRLWGISWTCWFAKANKQFPVHTDNNMFVTLSPVSYGGNWSGCQKQRDKSRWGITVVVIRPWNREYYTRKHTIMIVVAAKALLRWDTGDCFWLLTKEKELKALVAFVRLKAFIFHRTLRETCLKSIRIHTEAVPTHCNSF